MIPLTKPSIEEDDLDAVREVLVSGYLVQGQNVGAFERAIADYVGSQHAIAVNSCTSALHLALLALGIGEGDQVAVPTYSWPATANVVFLCGATPIFVDIEPHSYNMDPGALEATLKKTQVKLVLPVHTFGGLADMPRIVEVANRFSVPIVEDAACALGASLKGRKAGTWGAMACFSFHPRKAITTGEGGMITTDDPKLARTLRMLRNHGLDPAASAGDFVVAGYNLRLTDFQAALGRTQMTKLERIIEKRRTSAHRYDGLLAGNSVRPPVALRGSRHVYQSYVAQLPSEVAPRRKDLIAALKTKGIETSIGTHHIPLTTFFRTRFGFRPGDFPGTDNASARAITLPLYERITSEQQSQVVDELVALVKDERRNTTSAQA